MAHARNVHTGTEGSNREMNLLDRGLVVVAVVVVVVVGAAEAALVRDPMSHLCLPVLRP